MEETKSIINDIVVEKKKAKSKPKMSKIVDKAILLKELSLKEERTAPSEVPQEVLIPTKVVAREPRSPIGAPEGESPPNEVTLTTIPVSAYLCALCNIRFTSKTLFERHPRTIRHKMNEVKAIK